MSHRQSCDRCRQQKVRCLRDEAQQENSNPSSPGRASLSQCERCAKAGVDCVYSLKQRSARRSVQHTTRIDAGPEPGNRSGTPWFEQGLAAGLYQGGPALGSDFADLVGHFPGVDENGSVAGLMQGWDANLQPFSPTSLSSLPAPSATEVALMTRARPTTGRDEDSEDDDAYDNDDIDTTDALSSQLISLSQRATRTMRRLARPGRVPLTVSSPEVNEALEDTNTLIRIINDITAPDRDDSTLDPTTTDHGLAFSALACHQHLVALFRAICDAIHRCLEAKKEHQEQHHRSRQHSDIGPSSVAQFVMVLQLLMHLINRMDRTLFQGNPSMWQSARSSTDGNITPETPNLASQHEIHSIQAEAASEDHRHRVAFSYLCSTLLGRYLASMRG
ncbi:hypothetical protein ACCO45_007747 [Purpureocillium lilacinum]|uniref:Uncharacterized protein n=1 Tax=Purpureocillium lilacinum TaxID=33203 RepID=A0ACC4DLG7_PURLI